MLVYKYDRFWVFCVVFVFVSRSWEEVVEVVSKDWPLPFEFQIVVPLVQTLANFLLSNAQHVLRILPAQLLQAPSRRVVEIETA